MIVRDSGWQNRHLRRLNKNKIRRQKRRQRYDKREIAPEKAEAEYKAAQDRERQKKAPSIFLRFLYHFVRWIAPIRRWGWFKKIISFYQDRQYRGTK